MKPSSKILGVIAVAVGALGLPALGWVSDTVPERDPQVRTTTEYILIDNGTAFNDTAVTSNDKAMSIGRPLKTMTIIPDTNLKCGRKSNDDSTYSTDANFSGTNYGVYMLLVDSADRKGGRMPRQTFMFGENPGPAKKFYDWTRMGVTDETCYEVIDSVTYTFKKYSVTCEGCS
jgi:hypothetical protein